MEVDPALSSADEEGVQLAVVAADSPEACAITVADMMEAETRERRQQLLETVLTFLRRSEKEWSLLWRRAGDAELEGQGAKETWVVAILEAKALHDAQLIELIAQFGGAL